MKKVCLLILAGIGLAPSAALAGVYTDEMAKCLVESTSKDDRAALVRWMFAAVSQHPAVTSISNVKASDLEAANAETGALFMKLLTEKCVDTAKKAIQYEGPVALQQSFQVLGQVASMEMFSDPSVLAVMAGLEKYTDKTRLEALRATE